MKKIAIISTHPVQYYAPVFKLLAQKVKVKVFYTWGKEGIKKYDPGFGKKIEWDIPLLDGYDYEFLENTAKLSVRGPFFSVNNPVLIARIDDFKPDAILVYGWSYYSHLRVLKYFKGRIPIWFRGDSTLLNEPTGLKKHLKRLFLNWVYKNVDKVFYVGSANKTYFEKYGVKEDRLIFAPHAIDNWRFAEDRKSEAISLRRELGLSEEEILVLFAGKLEPVKDPELLLNAFSDLSQEKIRLLFVGNGILEETLKIKNSALGTERKVHFLPFQNQSQMPVIYQASDVFCLPSISETWGLAVNEAMAAGNAILVSDKVGCAQDLVFEGQNGFVFKASDLKDLKLKIAMLCADKRRITRFGFCSMQIISQWSFQNQVKVFYDELENARD